MRNFIRKGIRPGFRLVWDRPARDGEYRRVLPFKRSWVALLIIAAFDAVFLFPAIGAFNQAVSEWSRLDTLFDLVGALFITGWLMGWSLAPLMLTTLLLLMMFGREVVRARPGVVELSIGLLFVGFSGAYEVARMRNLRLERPEKKSGKAWRGPHAVFDYGANVVEFGSGIGEADLAAIAGDIQVATGQSIRRGPPTPEELEGVWEPNQIERVLKEERAPEEEEVGTPGTSTLSLSSPSTLLLIVANLVPVFGAAFLGWRLSDVMVLYWAESAVIGFYNALKMIAVARWFALLGVPFFIGHFGAFMAVHFLFLYGLFVKGPADTSGNDLGEVFRLFAGLWPALLALLISHGFSFYYNFVRRREYRRRNLKTQMTEPYGRIVFMHLVLIFGGGITLVLGEPAPVLILVIGLKIFFDIRAHLKQHLA